MAKATRGVIAGAISAAISLYTSPSAQAEFVGNLQLVPAGCESTGHCTMGQEFSFIDAHGVGWQAKKGLETDGATIPPWAQPFIGAPFDKSFIKAAVIHDHYCDRHVRTWRQTHEVFYEALLAGQVPKGKAGIMYFAVLVGGPKWLNLIKVNPCPIGKTCVNQVDLTASIPGSNIMIGEDGKLLAARPGKYDTAGFAQTMVENLAQLEAAGDGLTADQVEAQAAKAMADDFYFENGDSVGTSLGLILQTQ